MKHKLFNKPSTSTSPTMGGAFLKFAKGARCLTLLVLALLSTNLAWGGVEKVSASQLESGGKYIIVATYENSDYLLKPATFSAKSSSTAESFNTATVTDASAWTFTKSGNTWTIKLSTGEGLYFTNDNNGVACAESKGASFTITATTNNATTSYLTASDGTNTRYLALYQGSNWRCYKNTTSGVPTIQLYKITDAPAAKLTSIAISGTPTKTAYETGESFDVTGLTVTGTYDDASTADLTDEAGWTFDPATFTSTSQTSVSVTATVDGKTATETYNVTVTEHVVIPGTYEIVPNTTFFNVEVQTTGSHSAVTGKQNDITITHSGGSSFYCNNSQIRTYKDNTLTFSVPKGYEITSIVLAVTDNALFNADCGTYTASSKTWTGNAQQVILTSKQSSNNYQITKITVTYEAKKTLESIAVKSTPTTTTYKVGDKFNPAGLVITATYDTGDEEIAYAGNESDFTFSPDLTTALTTANTSVTITYGGKTTTQAITVNLNKLATPANLQATLASTSATLTWDAVANASSYEVNINNQTLTAETNSLLVEGLTANTEYLWSVKAIGDGTTYADSEASAESNFTTLAPPTVAYTVTFSGNGHGTPASESITETEPAFGVTLPNCTPNEGYQFIGWTTLETATEAEYEAGAIYHPTANITLYAVYNEVYTITWSVNGTPTTEGTPTTSVVAGEGITTLPTAPADISGMKFQGWTATQIETSSATKPTDLFTDAEHAPSIAANTTFYAVFAEEKEGDVTWNKVTTLAGITEGEYVIINGDFYLPNTTVTNTGPTAGDAPTISNNIIADANVTVTMKWSFTSTGTTNQFYVKNSNDNYLYATSDNNGVRVSNTSDKWTFAENTAGYFSMKEANNSRYCAKYVSGSDWRSYTSATHSNYANGGKLELYKKTQEITYTYYTNVVVKQLTSIKLSGEYPTEFWKGETFNHDGITVTAHYSNADDEDVTNKAEFSTPDMSKVGEQTVTVTYDTKSTTYNITVKTIANTQETAYTVEEAKAIIDANPAELATTEVYVKGTVSKVVTEWSSQYGNITFDVSADGQTTGNQFQFYRNFKGAENEKWTSAAECPAVGDDVIGYGTMKKHNSAYEFDAGNYLVSHVKASSLSIDNITVPLGGTISPEITTNVPEAGRTITYSVPSEDVVKVEGGNLVTVAVGGPVTVTATLTAEGYKDATTTFTVEVIKALQSIAVKDAPTNTYYKAGDKFDPTGLVITATYSDETTEDIAYEENKDKFTFEPSLETELTTDITSVTITYAGKETTQEISVRALYTYDIAWMANGEQFTTTQVTEGDALTLPETSPEAIGDFVFKGWIAAESYYDAETAPTYIVPAEIKPEGAMTFYAVFAKEVEVEGPKTYSLSPNDFKTGSYDSNDGDKEINGITLTINDVYQNSSSIQMRASSGSLFNKYALGTKITSVVVSVKTNSVKVYEGSTNASWTEVTGNEGTYTFSDNKAYFKVTSTSSYAQVNSITVNYIGKTTSYSNYCTKLASANMAITTAKWGTFCAPFDVTIPEGVKAYKADANGSNVTFPEVTTTIPAGTPVVVYSEEVVNQDFAGAATVNTNNCSSGVLVGVYAETSDITAEEGHTNYVLQNNNQGVGFYKATSTISLKANRCYMTLPTSADIKAFFAFDDMADGLNRILNSTDKAAEGIFDLNGHKLTAPRKGVNIINGVKVLVK